MQPPLFIIGHTARLACRVAPVTSTLGITKLMSTVPLVRPSKRRPNTPTPGANEEIRLLYQLSVADILNAKKEQFDITNYTLALQAVIVFVSQNNKIGALALEMKYAVCFALVIASLAFGAVAISYIRTLQSNIARFRGRILRLRERLTPEFKEAFGLEETPTYATVKFRPGLYYTITWLLGAAIVGTPLLVVLNLLA